MMPANAVPATHRSNPSSVPAELSPRSSSIPIPESIIRIISGQASYPERLKALHALASRLSSEEASALRQFLREHGLRAGFTPASGYALKDAVMIHLENQQPPPADWPEFLVEMYQDRAQDVVMRDYALQHLRTWYWKRRSTLLPGEDAARVESQKSQARQVFWEALQETESSIAGTALLALQELSATERDVEAGAVKAAALRLAGEPGNGPLCRIAALQVCGEMGAAEALPLVREAAKDSSHIPLQISAIHVLSQLGGSHELELLKELKNQGQPRLNVPLNAAITRLERQFRK